jgi:transcriptional regulator with XRE-family HTH domain
MYKTPQSLRDARKRAGISQSELALVLGISQSQVSDLERGHRGPKTTKEAETILAAIAKAAAQKERIEAAKREAIERVIEDFENPKMSADTGQ